MKYKYRGVLLICSCDLRRWVKAVKHKSSLCSLLRPRKACVCTGLRWSALHAPASRSASNLFCLSVSRNSLKRLVHLLTCLSSPCVPSCLKTHLQTPSSLNMELPELSASYATNLCWGTEKGLFHIMLHKPALNLGERAIRGWTHWGPREFSNMAAPPTPPDSRQALNQRWGSWLYGGPEISAGEMISC